jgi:hypothetical protein
MTYAQYEMYRQPLVANLEQKSLTRKRAIREFGENSPEAKEAILCYNVAWDACQVLMESARKAGAFKDSGMKL